LIHNLNPRTVKQINTLDEHYAETSFESQM
jgi:hypothetical protein